MIAMDKIIEGCLKGNAKCQKKMYDIFALKMLKLCHRYGKNISDAEDILQEGFIKVFNKLHTYNFQ